MVSSLRFPLTKLDQVDKVLINHYGIDVFEASRTLALKLWISSWCFSITLGFSTSTRISCWWIDNERHLGQFVPNPFFSLINQLQQVCRTLFLCRADSLDTVRQVNLQMAKLTAGDFT